MVGPGIGLRLPHRRRTVLAATVPLVVAVVLLGGGVGQALAAPPALGHGSLRTAASSDPVANFTSAINRLVELVGLSGAGILALVWARVALSWFSNDVTKKVQAKDRARDALVGTLLFVAAVSGLVWGLAHWVVTGA